MNDLLMQKEIIGFICSVLMLTNVRIENDQLVGEIPSAGIYQAVTNAFARQTFTEIHTYFVKNATVLNVNAKHHTNLLAEIVYWLDVKMVDNVRRELNALQLQAVLAVSYFFVVRRAFS